MLSPIHPSIPIWLIRQLIDVEINNTHQIRHSHYHTRWFEDRRRMAVLGQSLHCIFCLSNLQNLKREKKRFTCRCIWHSERASIFIHSLGYQTKSHSHSLVTQDSSRYRMLAWRIEYHRTDLHESTVFRWKSGSLRSAGSSTRSRHLVSFVCLAKEKSSTHITVKAQFRTI